MKLYVTHKNSPVIKTSIVLNITIKPANIMNGSRPRSAPDESVTIPTPMMIPRPKPPTTNTTKRTMTIMTVIANNNAPKIIKSAPTNEPPMNPKKRAPMISSARRITAATPSTKPKVNTVKNIFVGN